MKILSMAGVVNMTACCAAALVLSATAMPAAAAAAQAYPARPIRMVVTSTPSSGPDIIARLIGHKLTEAWGQQVIVDNRAGASGTIGAEIAARAAPDGYTLLLVPLQQAIVAASFEKLSYDLTRDFAPVSLLASVPFVLVINPSVAAGSIKELIALAKARPGELHYGSGGSGSALHIAAAILWSMTGIDLVHVPYKGVTPALTDTVGGQVQMTFVVIPAVLPLIKSGKVRAIGVTSSKRTPLVPDLPTIAESVPGYEFIGWYGLSVPAKTPAAIVSRLNSEVVKALKSSEFRDRLSGLGAEPIGTTPQEFASFMRAQIQEMRKAIKPSGARSG